MKRILLGIAALILLQGVVLAEPVCMYPYEGECWNRHTWLMTRQEYFMNAVGQLERRSELARKIQLMNHARRILYDSPPRAPLGEIWLVYYNLKWQLIKHTRLERAGKLPTNSRRR